MCHIMYCQIDLIEFYQNQYRKYMIEEIWKYLKRFIRINYKISFFQYKFNKIKE